MIWAEWNTTDANGNLLDLSQRRDTYYYVKDGERVYGKAKNILTDGEAAQYTVSNVLSGSDSWQPAIKTESCSAPAPVINGQNIEWDAVPYAICYIVADGDNIIEITTSTSISLPDLNTNNISVQAVNEFGGLSAKGIAEVETSGMESIDLNAYKIIAIYDVYGHSLTEAVPGINIVHYLSAEGTLKVKKVFVR